MGNIIRKIRDRHRTLAEHDVKPVVDVGSTVGVMETGIAVIDHKCRTPEDNASVKEQVFGAGRASSRASSDEFADSTTSEIKRPSGAKFFGGGGDYKLFGRRPSPTSPSGPPISVEARFVTAAGGKRSGVAAISASAIAAAASAAGGGV